MTEQTRLDGLSGWVPAWQGVKRLKPHLLRRLIDTHKMDQCLIFCRTNFDCDNLEKFLTSLGGVASPSPPPLETAVNSCNAQLAVTAVTSCNQLYQL